MSKFNPANKEEAFVYQFEDIVKCMKSASIISKASFQYELGLLKRQIQAYEISGGKEVTYENME